MRTFITGALVAIAVAGASAVAVSPPAAAADVGISINTGDVAFGYSDGYWDRDHHWHAWRNPDEAAYYKAHVPEHYVDKRHDEDAKDKDKGWKAKWW